MKSFLDVVKNIAFFIFSVIGIVLGLYYIVLFINTDRKNYNINNSWVDCIGTMTEIGNNRSGATKFGYYYKSEWYENYSYINIHSKIFNDKYILKVNPQNPNKYIPLAWKPVFSSDENTNKTKGEIEDLSEPSFWSKFFISGINEDSLSKIEGTFMYYVSGEKIEKTFHLPPNYKVLYPNLKVGQTYEVEYLEENPNRAIIHLDRPVNDTGR